jgi:putative flippase GtrA
MLNSLFIFAKAQISAFLGGIADYLLMIFITEYFGVHYTISIVLGGIAGAIINFSVNRKWTFLSKDLIYDNSLGKQLSKFLIVLLMSIMLKSSGTYFFASFLNADYRICRLMTDALVSLLINYTLQKHWVFKKVKS